MEQKRSLLILIASGIFLLIVLGAALILHSPSKFDFNKNNTFASPFAKNDEAKAKPQIDLINANDIKKDEIDIPNQNYFNVMDSSDPYTSETSQAQAAQAAQATPEIQTAQIPLTALATPVPQNTQNSPDTAGETQISSTGANGQNITTDTVTVIANGSAKIYGAQDSITINLNSTYNPIPAPVVIAQNDAAKKAINETKENRIYESHKLFDEKPKANSAVKESNKTETKKASASNTTNTANTTNTKKASEKKATQNTNSKNVTTKVPDRFWVQVASYTSKKTADEARAKLDSNKIQCEVFTHNDGNKLYYRVRVGPYTTKTEAEYWKKRLEEIDTFKNCGSYIVNSSAAK